MSQYLIIINTDEKAALKNTVEQQKEISGAFFRYTEELKKAGVFLAGEGLESSAKGARITHKEGRRVVTDGPFTEAKEVIGGFYMIEAKTRDEAIDWAAKCPSGPGGNGVELRSVMSYPK